MAWKRIAFFKIGDRGLGGSSGRNKTRRDQQALEAGWAKDENDAVAYKIRQIATFRVYR
jgi:hypothetical protein